MTQYKKLFDPGYIGKLKLKNRIIQAPMYTVFAARDGSVNSRLINYYKERAKGGTGLVIIEASNIDNKVSGSGVCRVAVSDDSYGPGLSTLARTIQDNGARVGIQINHVGRQRFVSGGEPGVAPSRVPWAVQGSPSNFPKELTIEGIREIVKSFGNAARIAERSGFDMVEILGGHGYLIAQFFSPFANRRADIYGGSLGDRMRFALEVVESVRNNVGKDFPIGMRISGSEYVEGGITIEDSIELVMELEEVGVDIIHVSGGAREPVSSVTPMLQPLAFNVHLAEAIKQVVHIPVIASGSITNPQIAEEILRKGQADFISLARPLLADPRWAIKAKEGKGEDIAPCIRCNECLRRGTAISRAVSCTVNPAVGFEGEYEIKPTDKVKKIAVIGSGPGGMEAACVAALKGHDVTVYEKSDWLGGRLNAMSEFFIEIANLVNYLSTQLQKLGVKVVTGKEATVQMIQQQGFDVVILATGTKPLIPDIRGIDKSLVMTVDDLLSGKDAGQNVVVIGGGLVGCETVYLLALAGKLYGASKYRKMLPKGAEQQLIRLLIDKKLPSSLRKNIRIIEPSEDVADGIERGTKQALFEGFSKWGVQVNTGLLLDEVINGGVITFDRYGEKHKFEADSVVLTDSIPNDDLLEELEEANILVYPIGDCVSPRKIYDAIHEGFLAGYHV